MTSQWSKFCKVPAVVLFASLALYACGGSSNSANGGSEFGNPSRGLIGTVTTASALTKSAITCPADSVIATDSLAATTEASIGSDCSFDMSLETGKAYILSFLEGGSFVATMIVNNGAVLGEGNVFFLSDGPSDVDLGDITFEGDAARPENEPAEQCDRDGDGDSDFDDDDDDDDGVNDEDESDCDDDEFEDDEDDEDSCDGEDDSGDDESEDGGSGGSGSGEDEGVED